MEEREKGAETETEGDRDPPPHSQVERRDELGREKRRVREGGKDRLRQYGREGAGENRREEPIRCR
jgi:hypothetical protein